MAKKVEAPKPAASAPVTSAPAGGAHHAQIKVTKTSWISVSADGKQIYAKTAQEGEVVTIDFTRRSYVHLGNAAGVELTLDGKAQTLGPGRALRLVKFEPTGMSVIPWSDGDPNER